MIIWEHGTTKIVKKDEYVVITDGIEESFDSLKQAIAHAIENELSDEDIEAWHNGEITPNVDEILNDVKDIGYYYVEIWGVRNPEPGQEAFHVWIG